MMWKKMAVVSLALATPSATLADQFFAVTPNGAVETDFSGVPADSVSKLSNRCLDVGWRVISSTETVLICESPMSMGQSIIGQALLGNSYSTPPRRFIQFNAASAGAYTRVQASAWIELQMAFGQMRRTDLNGPELANSMVGFMQNAGGRLPIGTTFPNHAVMGVAGLWVSNGKRNAYTIQQVDPGSEAQAAGISPGDIVTKIAGKSINGESGLLDGLAKAAKSPSYPVELIRDGKTQTVALKRAFRPAIAKLDFGNNQPSPAANPQSPDPALASALSVADELAKFARLKDQGILTNEEFEAQKKKLLGL